jgi:predicted RNase H-like HicB family nuclease
VAEGPTTQENAGGHLSTAYRIEVHWSVEDGAWIADVPDLPYCTAHGPTPHEAVAELETAMESWLEAARSGGRPVPEPSSCIAEA